MQIISLNLDLEVGGVATSVPFQVWRQFPVSAKDSLLCANMHKKGNFILNLFSSWLTSLCHSKSSQTGKCSCIENKQWQQTSRLQALWALDFHVLVYENVPFRFITCKTFLVVNQKKNNQYRCFPIRRAVVLKQMKVINDHLQIHPWLNVTAVCTLQYVLYTP